MIQQILTLEMDSLPGDSEYRKGVLGDNKD